MGNAHELRYGFRLLAHISDCLADMQVPSAVPGVARFSFEELCAQPLGAADYLALAQTYHTLFLLNIPAMSLQASIRFSIAAWL